MSYCVLSWSKEANDRWQPTETLSSIIKHQCLLEWTLATSLLLLITFVLLLNCQKVLEVYYVHSCATAVFTLKCSFRPEIVCHHGSG